MTTIALYWEHLDVDDDELYARRATLSTSERAQADRYIGDEDGRRFLARRALLRAVLADRLDCSPAEVQLGADEAHGKPFLRDLDAAGGPGFNSSHSGAVAVVAVTDGGAVGVDVEVLRPHPAAVEVALRFFTPAEAAAVAALPPRERTAGFLRVWTRKEAWLKATGTGLSVPLASFEVSGAPDDARLLRIGDDADAALNWGMADVSGRHFGVNVVGAVVAPGRDWAVRSHDRPAAGARPGTDPQATRGSGASGSSP